MTRLLTTACAGALAVALTTLPVVGGDPPAINANSSSTPPSQPAASASLPKIIRGPLLPAGGVGDPPHGRESVQRPTSSLWGTSSLGPLPRIIRGPLSSSVQTATVLAPGSTTTLQPSSDENSLIESLRQIGKDVQRTGAIQAIPRPQSGGTGDLIQNLRELEQSINSTGILQRIRPADGTNDTPRDLIESLRGVDHAVRTQVRPALQRISNDHLPSKVLPNNDRKP